MPLNSLVLVIGKMAEKWLLPLARIQGKCQSCSKFRTFGRKLLELRHLVNAAYGGGAENA